MAKTKDYSVKRYFILKIPITYDKYYEVVKVTI